MEVLFILIAGLYFCLHNEKLTSAEEGLEDSVPVMPAEGRMTMLNPEYYDDPEAFMRIAHVLGF